MSANLICRVIVPPSTDACGKPSVYVVTFTDGDRVLACADCSAYLKQTAQSHGTNLKAERIRF